MSKKKTGMLCLICERKLKEKYRDTQLCPPCYDTTKGGSLLAESLDEIKRKRGY